MPELSDVEWKMAIIRVGEAFKALPDDRSRLDVLASLTGVMATLLSKENKQSGLFNEWLLQAEETLKGCVRIYKTEDL